MDQDHAFDQQSTSEVIIRRNYDVQLRDFEQGLLNFLSQQGLPTSDIFVSVHERLRVFNNIDAALQLLDEGKKTILYTYLNLRQR